MKEKKVFNLSEFEKKTMLVPSSIHYKLTDDEFLHIAKDIIEEYFGSCPYEFRLSSGTDNELQILNTGDLIYKIFKEPTRIQLIHSNYYILKFILSQIIDENIYVQCTTSYRSQNKLYVNIVIETSWNKFKDITENDSNKSNTYFKIIEQISVLEKKKINLIEENR